MWLWLACADDGVTPGGADTVDPADVDAITFVDGVLAAATVGAAYEAQLSAKGGEGGLTFSAEPGTLPVGLTLSSTGLISGIPTEGGRHFDVLASAADAYGQVQFAHFDLEVVFEPRVVTCGERFTGAFTSGGWAGEDVDWTDLGGYEWVHVAWPEELTTRVELVFELEEPLNALVRLPGTPITSHNVEDHYKTFTVGAGFPEGDDSIVTIDLGTDPALAGFEDEGGIPVILVAPSAQSYGATVVCTDGPIFDWTLTLPVRLGDPIEIDFDVIGSDEGIRIWTDDPIPDFYVWDEGTGVVTGTAEAAGGWEFDLHAEDAEGRSRTERAILSVYDVTDLPCDTSVPLVVEEGMYDGDFTGPYDARGFDVFRIAYDAGVSHLDVELRSGDDSYLGNATPLSPYPFYADGDSIVAFGYDPQLPVGPTTYPSWANYELAGEMYVIAAPVYDWSEGEVEVRCDRNPRYGRPALPVLRPEMAEEVHWPVAGGEAPTTISATGLPLGVTVVSDGTVRTPKLVEQEAAVVVEVGDATGASLQTPATLFVGDALACADATPVSCGDVIDGAFLQPYWEDEDAPEGTLVVCLVPRDHRSVFFEVSTLEPAEIYLSLGDPAGTASGLIDGSQLATSTWVDWNLPSQVYATDYAWPYIWDYDRLPMRTILRAWEPGTYSLSVECYD